MKTLLSALACLLSVSAAAMSGSEAVRQLLNSRSSGSTLAYTQAAEQVARDAEKGYPLQKFLVAVFSKDPFAPSCLRLTSEKRNEYLAYSRPKIKALAENTNNPLAWYLLSLETNDRKLLRRAVDGENPQALNAWGTILIQETLSMPGLDTNGVFRVMEKSFDCFRKAAATGDSNGLYNLGMCYLHGYGCAPDPEKALSYFKAAEKLDHPEAINNIGGFYRDGIVVEKDDFLATRKFQRSADLGNAYGQLNYALALQRGEGVAKDEPRAAKMLLAAAESGSAEAMNAYGDALMKGLGVEKSETAAVAWFRRSAQRGFPPAMENLSFCYEGGIGGLPKDYREGTVWKMRARAARGDRNAAVWLAQNGYGMK